MNDAKEEVRAKLAIEDVIGEYVQLKRAGRLWKGLSPFTNERTPSFTVTPDRDIWHDFSSGQGGDVFDFIELIEGVEFREALEILAKKAGVDLGRYDSRTPRDLAARKEKIFEMNRLAVNYFQREMTQNRAALEYIFARRHLEKSTVLEWGIGYAPRESRLKEILLAHKFSAEEIRDAGLVSARGYEMFRQRMMIPLRDGVGQIVGFTGRIVGDGEPKYLNTPGTILYDKGRQLFGLNFAKNAIRKADFAILVEGNLDVISSHQAGTKNIVAAAGTALTKYHLKSLQRLSRNLYLCFDGDRAGIAATERAINLSQDIDLKLDVIDWSGYDFGGKSAPKDPDEIITSFGAATWADVVQKSHSPAIDWVIEKYVAANDLSSADGQKIVSDKSLALVKNLRDRVEQEFYLKKIAQILRTPIEVLRAKMNGENFVAGGENSRRKLRETKIARRNFARNSERNFTNMIFALAWKFPRLKSIVANVPDEYLSELFVKIKYLLLEREVVNSADSPEMKAKITPEMADKLAELELIATVTFAKNDDARVMVLTNILELEKLKTRGKIESLSQELAVALGAGDADKAKIINGAVNALRSDLNLLEKSSRNNDFAGLRELWQKRKAR